MDRKTAERRAQALLSESGLGTIGSRTAKEIAERVTEKAALAIGISERARTALEHFLAVEGSPEQALKSLRGLAKRDKLDIAAVVDRFEKRIDAFARRGVDTETLTFAADFGRRLDYYTGFVFEIHDPRRRDGRQIIGGGRYDRLISLIGHSGSIPAVGFAIWLDRIGRKS
jgi:ATP phosphoribosyltransferase regulatory subunit